jgi:phytoene synthase
MSTRAALRTGSKSFWLASLLLGPRLRDDAAGLYAYCRRADDLIDLAPPGSAQQRLSELREELELVYAGATLHVPELRELQRLVFDKRIPRQYPEALLRGFQLDVEGKTYDTLSELYDYCWCVAGSVGAMMCHVLGVRRERAVAHGVHLGMAMQLTNICRDVAEDWQRGRLYLPTELLPGLPQRKGITELSAEQRAACAAAVRQLLEHASTLYASGDRGLPYLAFRSRLAVATARRVYAAIGARLLEQQADLLAPRAFVPLPQKLVLAAGATFSSLRTALGTPRFSRAPLLSPLRYPQDVLPV